MKGESEKSLEKDDMIDKLITASSRWNRKERSKLIKAHYFK